jgi:hypothetical protein
MKLKNISFHKKPVILLGAAALLLIGSTVGSTRAALTYYSENYVAQVAVSNIGVTLNENGSVVSTGDSENGANTGVLLGNMLETAGDSKIVLGKDYQEEISVTNSGTIDQYVRVILYKSWQDADGNKDTNLSPDLIDLNLIDNGWVVDEAASTPERTVLYYTEILPAGDTSSNLTDTLSIDPSISQKMTTEVTEADGYKTITSVYDYNGYTFNIEAEVDAVQTHNAQDAIKSAWGVDVNVSDGGSLSLR